MGSPRRIAAGAAALQGGWFGGHDALLMWDRQRGSEGPEGLVRGLGCGWEGFVACEGAFESSARPAPNPAQAVIFEPKLHGISAFLALNWLIDPLGCRSGRGGLARLTGESLCQE